uniref:U20-Hexatoxin-Hf1ar_1 n=1 Tax=Hadronyche formidabilis TaxID=426499 RepID=A0A4V2H9N7_HADFO
MLKFAVLCFLVIMASTFAEQCGDQVCGAGSCCAEYPEMHCKRVGQLCKCINKCLLNFRTISKTYYEGRNVFNDVVA